MAGSKTTPSRGRPAEVSVSPFYWLQGTAEPLGADTASGSFVQAAHSNMTADWQPV